MVTSIRRLLRRNQLLTGILVGVLLNLSTRGGLVPSARATSKPLAQLISPTAAITLVANTPLNIPLPAGYSGIYCTVAVWNNSTTPVYWGGPTTSAGASTTGTVNIGGSMPICTDSAVCRDSFVTINTTQAALIAGVNINTVRYVLGGGC